MDVTTTTPRARERIRLDPVTPELLGEVIHRIVEAVEPEQIILFGSYAHGTPHEYSDMDLFVIKDAPQPRKVAAELYGLFWDLSVPLDILVKTPEQVAFALEHGNSFLRHHVLERGKVLYERDHP
jgi:predicted nucleotidyltransferase